VRLAAFGGNGDLVYYFPESQIGAGYFTLMVRVRGNAGQAIDGLRRSIQPLMPGAGYVTIRAMEDVVAPSMRSWQLGATMFATFGGLALLLAALGLYGVIAHSVVQRRHEMGVRVALGARAGDITGLVVRESLRVVSLGVAIGVGGAIVAGRWISDLLFKVSPRDPMVLLAVVATLLIVSFLASWIPALRAAAVPPGEALRAD
jgi:putative ABC transport system permease protein